MRPSAGTLSFPETPRFAALKSVWNDMRRVASVAVRLPIVARHIARNLTRRDSILGSEPVVVSLTSYGSRLRYTFIGLESIAAGRVKPARAILWLTREDADRASSMGALRRLQKRGLEIRVAEDYLSHKKYYPALETCLDSGLDLVCADDDVIYSADWLAGLVGAAASSPSGMACWRAHRVGWTADEQLDDYATWMPYEGAAPGRDLFATGGSGTYLPRALLEALLQQGVVFMDLCPKGDDIWLNFTARKIGLLNRQVGTRPRLFPSVPFTQGVALNRVNVKREGNRPQLNAVLQHYSLLRDDF